MLFSCSIFTCRFLNFLLLTLFVVSLFFAVFCAVHQRPWVMFYQDFAVFIALVSGCLLCLIFGRINFVIPKFCFFIITLVPIPILQFLFGKVFYFGDALLASAYLVGACLSLIAGASLYNRFGLSFVICLSYVFVFFGVISCFVAILQWLHLDAGPWVTDRPEGTRVFANFAQPNNFSTFLGFSFVSLLILKRYTPIGRLLFSVLLAFILFILAVTQSRTAWMFSFVVVVFYSFYLLRKNYIHDFKFLIFWFCFFWFCVLVLPYINEILLLSGSENLERLKHAGRLGIWFQIVSGLMQEPLFGYGWNQVSVAQVAGALSFDHMEFVEHSHNIVLDILVWNGLLVGGCIIVFLVCFFLIVFKKLDSDLSYLLLLMLGLFVTHAMLEFPHDYALFLFPSCLIIGVLLTEQRWGVITFSRKMMLSVLVLVTMLGFQVAREYVFLQNEFQTMRYRQAGIVNAEPPRKLDHIVLLTNLKSFLIFAQTEAEPNMDDEELEMMRKVSLRYAYPPAMFRYILALGLNGRTDEARDHLARLNGIYSDSISSEAVDNIRTLSNKYPELSKIIE